jgi:hypothetical protein
MNKETLALTAMAMLMLTACGGGSDENNTSTATPAPVVTTPAPAPTPTPTPPVTSTPAPAITASAEGVYEGMYGSGLTHLTLVTDDTFMYTIVGTTTGGVFAINRFLVARGSSTNGAFTAPEVHAYGSGATAATGTFTGTYAPGASLNGSLQLDGASTTMTGSALANSTYNYNTPATLANVAGAWTLTGVDGARVMLTVGADGNFTGTNGTCSVTGSFVPRASGKNVFNFKVISGPAPCARPADVSTGVAVEFSIGSTRQLVAAATGVTLVNGTGWIGSR